jgi:hypothetical protein
VAALLAVVVVIAFVVGRVTAPSHHASHASTGGPASTTTSVSGEPAPSRVLDGVPIGYPDSEAGAVAALLTDGQTLSDPHVLFNSTRRTQVLALIATAHYASTFSGSSGQALDQAERQTPLGRGILSSAQAARPAAPGAGASGGAAAAGGNGAAAPGGVSPTAGFLGGVGCRGRVDPQRRRGGRAGDRAGSERRGFVAAVASADGATT